jgi:hypothetical protein
MVNDASLEGPFLNPKFKKRETTEIKNRNQRRETIIVCLRRDGQGGGRGKSLQNWCDVQEIP